MFLRRKPVQDLSPTNQCLEWDRASRRTQSSTIRVTSWNLKLTPMLLGQHGGKTELSFEGKARLGTVPKVSVLGEIEILNNGDSPRMLQDRWKKVPEEIEGYASLSTDDIQPPRLDLTLYCTREMIERISLAFSTGSSSLNGYTFLDIDLGYPDDQGQDFWKVRWQSETLQVLTWRINAGAAPVEAG